MAGQKSLECCGRKDKQHQGVRHHYDEGAQGSEREQTLADGHHYLTGIGVDPDSNCDGTKQEELLHRRDAEAPNSEIPKGRCPHEEAHHVADAIGPHAVGAKHPCQDQAYACIAVLDEEMGLGEPDEPHQKAMENHREDRPEDGGNDPGGKDSCQRVQVRRRTAEQVPADNRSHHRLTRGGWQAQFAHPTHRGCGGKGRRECAWQGVDGPELTKPSRCPRTARDRTDDQEDAA